MLDHPPRVELDMLASQVLLSGKGAVVLCNGCHYRTLWLIDDCHDLKRRVLESEQQSH